MEFRTYFNQPFNTVHDARKAISKYTRVIERALRDQYGREYKIEVDEMSDTAQMMGSLASVDEKDTSLSQHFRLQQGWKNGANVRLFWPVDDNKMFLEVSGESKLEDRGMMFIMGTPLMIFAGWGWLGLKVKLKLLGLLLGGFIGGVIGVAAYFLLANPIISLLLGQAKSDNAMLASDISEYLIPFITKEPETGSEDQLQATPQL